MQWNVFKRVYFYWEKSTPQFKIELISGEYFFPCESKFFPGKYYSGSTFFPRNYYSGSNFFRGVIICGYTGTAWHIGNLEGFTIFEKYNTETLKLLLKVYLGKLPLIIVFHHFNNSFYFNLESFTLKNMIQTPTFIFAALCFQAFQF